jgi:EAL domain-containing protein (putative c-di-GMP-specific phosphodiesterase class I)
VPTPKPKTAPPAEAAATQSTTPESLGWQLRAALPPMRLHSITLCDHEGDVLWLSEGALGPDEHGFVSEAVAALQADGSLAHCESDLQDGRYGVFLAVRAPQGDLVGLAMILADSKGLGNNIAARILTQQVRLILQKISIRLRPQSATATSPNSPPAAKVTASSALPVAPAVPVVPKTPPAAAAPARPQTPPKAALSAPVINAFVPQEKVVAPPARPQSNPPVDIGSTTSVLSPLAVDEILSFELVDDDSPIPPPAQEDPVLALSPTSAEVDERFDVAELSLEEEPVILSIREPGEAPQSIVLEDSGSVPVLSAAATPEIPIDVPVLSAAPEKHDDEPLLIHDDMEIEDLDPPVLSAAAPETVAPAPAQASSTDASSDSAPFAASRAKSAALAKGSPRVDSSDEEAPLLIHDDMDIEDLDPPVLTNAAPSTATPAAADTGSHAVAAVNTSASSSVVLAAMQASVLGSAAPKSRASGASANAPRSTTASSLTGYRFAETALRPSPLTDPAFKDLALSVQLLNKLRPGGRTKRYEVLVRYKKNPTALEAAREILKSIDESSDIDGFVVCQLLTWLAEHPQANEREPLAFSINLSSRALFDERFPDFIAFWLRKTGVAAESIGFELPESLCVQHKAEAERFVAACEKLGCFIVLDDFAMDTRALDFLRSKSLKLIKLDPRLTNDAMKDKLSQALVIAISQAAKVLGVHCAAKKIESQMVRRWITAIGFDFAQGTLFEGPQHVDGLLPK